MTNAARSSSLRPVLFVGYVALQAYVVVGLAPALYPDSATYENLSLTGADLRLPTVPLLYKILPTDTLRVAGQALLAAVAWWVLATVVSRTIVDRRVRVGLTVVLLTLGLTAQVANWNSAILSESASISLTVLMIAGWLAYTQEPRWATAAGALAATLLWTLTRQPNVLFGLLLTGVGVVAAALRRDRLAVAVAAGLLLVSVVGFVEIHRNQTLSRGALDYIVQGRILPSPSYNAWFVTHGMPPPRYDPHPPKIGRPVPRNPAFVRWLGDEGQRTYVRFVFTHPRYAMIQPLKYFLGEPDHRPPVPSMLDPGAKYGRHRALLPPIVDAVFFDTLLALVGLTVGLSWLAWRRTGPDRRLLVPGLVALWAIPEAYIVWISGGEATHELDRLSMIPAVSIRIGLWIALALAVDRLLAPRPPRPDAVPSGRRSPHAQPP